MPTGEKFIQRDVLLYYLTNLFIMHRIQHPRILDNHWPCAVYTRSCSITFSEISLTWHGTCLFLYDNLCLEVQYHPLFSTFSLVIFPLFHFFLSQRWLLLVSFSYPYSLVTMITSFLFYLFFSFLLLLFSFPCVKLLPL